MSAPKVSSTSGASHLPDIEAARPTSETSTSHGCSICSRGRVWTWVTGILTPVAGAGACWGFATAASVTAYVLSGAAAVGAVAGAVGFVASCVLAPEKGLEDRVKDLGAVNVSLKGEIAELRAFQARVQAAAAAVTDDVAIAHEDVALTVGSLRMNNERLQAQLLKAQTKVSELSSILQAYRQQVERMTGQVRTFAEAGADLSATVESAGAVVIDMSAHADRIAQAAHIIDIEEDSMREERSKLDTLVAAYSEQISILQATLQDLTISKAALALRVDQLEEAESKLAAAETRIELLTQRMDAAVQLMREKFRDMDEAWEVEGIRALARDGTATAAASLLPNTLMASPTLGVTGPLTSGDAPSQGKVGAAGSSFPSGLRVDTNLPVDTAAV